MIMEFCSVLLKTHLLGRIDFKSYFSLHFFQHGDLYLRIQFKLPFLAKGRLVVSVCANSLYRAIMDTFAVTQMMSV